MNATPLLSRIRAAAISDRSPTTAEERSVMTARRPKKRTRATGRRRALAALSKQSDRQLQALIRRRLAMPLEQRMNFLRKRLPGGGSCL